MSNPFTLTFGAVPELFISRPTLTNRIIEDFSSIVPTSRTYMITGVRGSGKTVMLTEIARALRGREDWIAVELNPEDDLMTSLAAKLYNLEKIKPLFLKSKIDVSFAGVGASFENVNPGITSEVAVEKMLAVLAKHDSKLLITIDEAVNNEYVRRFAHSYQIFIRQDYPVYLIMTGLYDNIYNLQNEKTLTFLYRVPRITLEPLDISMVANMYGRHFEISSDESVEMAKLTKGYPFAFQVLGYIRWEHKDSSLDGVVQEYDHYLAEYIYDKIWHELGNTDKKVVSIISDGDGYKKIQDVREKLGMSSSLFSTYREKLIRKGLVDVSRYGYIGLILPRFSEYVIRRCEIEGM